MRSSPNFTGSVEFARRLDSRPGIRHVLFDFDGTLSLIREGWPEVMVPLFEEWLPAKPGESPQQRRHLVIEDIMRLNGKQTIYQMIQLADRIRERGGRPEDPLVYKKEYLRRLDERIRERKAQLRESGGREDTLLVHGARALLENLAARGLQLHLASGTDEACVTEEARLLGVDAFFGNRIHGARDDYKSFSKKMVIDRILEDHGVEGRDLMAFGDGYVEIENTKHVGGLAVAVASDEAHNGSGRVDAWKRARLLGVGADLVIPDFRDAAPLMDLILGT